MKRFNELQSCIVILLLVKCIIFQSFVFANQQQNYTGTFVLEANETVLKIILKESQNKVTGTLSSSTGMSFTLDGTISEGIAMGVCSSQQGSVFFEAYLSGQDLTLSLIEPDNQNMPDYDNAQYLVFTKQSTQVTAPSSNPSLTDQLFYQKDQVQTRSGDQNVSAANQEPATGNHIGDPTWGFTFALPDGWVHQKGDGVILLGHNSIPGLVVVMPHMVEGNSQLLSEMKSGIQEEGVYMMLSGDLTKLNEYSIAGDYSGTWDGTEASAKGIGTLSPYGGGAFIFAVSTPEQIGSDLISVAKFIAKNIHYNKIDISDLIRHFAGKWTSFTTNTTTWMYLYPNGIYSEEYEASYAGDFTDDVGDVTGNWGVSGASNDRGKWIVRGNKNSGVIIIKMANGAEQSYEYKVHVEKGYTYYNEYWFNGSLYSKSAIE